MTTLCRERIEDILLKKISQEKSFKALCSELGNKRLNGKIELSVRYKPNKKYPEEWEYIGLGQHTRKWDGYLPKPKPKPTGDFVCEKEVVIDENGNKKVITVHSYEY